MYCTTKTIFPKKQVNHNSVSYRDYCCWFPDEVLELVALRLDSSKDIESFCEAFPFLKHFLHGSRQQWLFDQVFPLLVSWLLKREVLTCRQVCRYWKKGVDHIFEYMHAYAFAPSSHPENRGGIRTISLPVDFLKNLDFFPSLIENTLAGSVSDQDYVIGKSVKLFYPGNGSKENCERYLGTVGHQIWHLKMRIQCNTLSSLQSCFLHFLNLCPNLRSLQVKVFYIGEREMEEMLSGTTVSSTEELFDLWKSALQSVWPNHLEFISLEIRGGCKYLPKYKKMLLSLLYSPLEGLVPADQNISDPIDFLLVPKQLYKLDYIIKTGDQINLLLNSNAPLTHLNLKVEKMQHINGTLQAVYEIIQNFENSLRSLSIAIEDDSQHYPCKRLCLPVLKLPYLESLSIRLRASQFTLLQNFPAMNSLEYLTFHTDPQEAMDNLIYQLPWNYFGRDIWTTLECENTWPYHSPYESELWNLFPKLREFRHCRTANFPTRVALVRLYRRDSRDSHHVLTCGSCQRRNSSYNAEFENRRVELQVDEFDII